MDSLDIRLLRAMFRGSVFTLYGFDPRAPIQQLARSVGTSRLTVRRRLARWRSEGFLTEIVTFPNPALIGTCFQMQALLLDRTRDRKRLEEAIAQILEPVFTFQSDSIYTPVLLAEPAKDAERRQQALRESGLGRVLCPPLNIAFPPCTLRLSRRDWQIIDAACRRPEPTWGSIAIEVGLTVRSIERRIHRLRTDTPSPTSRHSIFAAPQGRWSG